MDLSWPTVEGMTTLLGIIKLICLKKFFHQKYWNLVSVIFIHFVGFFIEMEIYGIRDNLGIFYRYKIEF